MHMSAAESKNEEYKYDNAKQVEVEMNRVKLLAGWH